ncbi:MAG TPA: geranylgeranyl reductase family protein [Vicinamibacterales bacterium]|nr:geranylgeranyl reductase family protein [Vicinamibacterales bacterium]
MAHSLIVAGAGPAGATAARRLATAGRQVLLLDRRSFPRPKPCGGGISIRALTRFPYLERELPRIATHTIRRLHLEGPDGQSAVVQSDGPAALMIRRVEFDDLLVSLAVEAGAELVAGAEIVQARESYDEVQLVARDGRRFTASTVIAADGVHSVIARRLGLNPGWPASSVALDMMEETPRAALRDVDPSTLWVSYAHQPHGAALDRSRSAPEGYAYIFPKRDHVNIGVGYVLSYYREAMEDAPYELQRELIDHLRQRRMVEGESVKENFTPFLIPVGGPLRSPARGRVLLAGDAGGFVNGFTAEGIYYAMVSGELAADAVLADDPRPVADRYCRMVDAEIGDELRDSVLLQRYLFADRRRIIDVIEGAGRAHALTKLILDFAMGRMSYRSLRRRMLVRSPMLAAHLLWAHLN